MYVPFFNIFLNRSQRGLGAIIAEGGVLFSSHTCDAGGQINSDETDVELTDLVGESSLTAASSGGCPVNEVILSNITFRTEGRISELYLNIRSRTDLRIYTHLTKGLAPGRRRVDFTRPWNVLPGSCLAFLATSLTGNSPLDCHASTHSNNHAVIGGLRIGDVISLEKAKAIERNVKFLAFVYRRNYLLKFHVLYETFGLRRITLILQREDTFGTLAPRQLVEALVEVHKSPTAFHLSMRDYLCCENTTIQLHPQEYGESDSFLLIYFAFCQVIFHELMFAERKDLTQFYWKFVCLNGTQTRTSSPMLGVFVPTPTVCEVELTVQVEGHITQIIRHNITFHARQREVSVGEYLRMVSYTGSKFLQRMCAQV
eukprot:TsM_000647500 transcript=TsM_000647500 gene=TsM_000647500